MERNVELPAELRAAAQSQHDATDALAWRELLESAAAEIERLHGLIEQNGGARAGADSRP